MIGATTITLDREIRSYVMDNGDFFHLSFALNKKMNLIDRTKVIEYFDDLVLNIREQLNDNNDKTEIEIPS